MTARYRVYARDVAYRNLGEIPDYGEVKAELRFNDVAGWHLTAAANSRAADLLTETGGIIITRDNLGGNGPSVVFSGPVTDFNLDAETLEVAGSSDELLLIERAASPYPDGPPYGTEQDIRSGTASTVMLAYVSANCGPDAIARRKVSELTIGTDLGLGSTVYGQARWISLLALMQELALAGGGLRFQVLQSSTATAEIEFTVSEPADRTATVVVSRGRHTMGEWKRTVVRPSATYVYVLGQGQGVNRQVVEGGDGATAAAYGRYSEMIADRRDTDDVQVLEQTRANLLAENGEARVVAYTPLDAPSMTWGVDYDLGDLVTVITPDGEQLTEVVRGVDLTLSAPSSGSATPEVQPIVSTPGDTADDPASRQERAVNRRVSNLERNIDSLAAAVAVQWNLGDVRLTTRSDAAPGWILCQGQAVSRTTYSALFGIISTTYGAGDGSTTFNVPDFQDRAPVGKSGTKALGASGGAATINIAHSHTGPPHTHTHTHTGPSHAHTGAPHVHAGPSHVHSGPSHQHTGAPHTHSHTHTGPSHAHTGAPHTHPGSHSHSGTTGAASTETNNLRTVSPEEADAAAKDHTHNYSTGSDSNVFAASFSGDTGAAGTGATGSDASAASYSGDSGAAGTGDTGASGTANTGAAGFSGSTGLDGTGATGSDASAASFSGDTGTALSATQSVQNPYLAVNYEIYAGV